MISIMIKITISTPQKLILNFSYISLRKRKRPDSYTFFLKALLPISSLSSSFSSSSSSSTSSSHPISTEQNQSSKKNSSLFIEQETKSSFNRIFQFSSSFWKKSDIAYSNINTLDQSKYDEISSSNENKNIVNYFKEKSEKDELHNNNNNNSNQKKIKRKLDRKSGFFFRSFLPLNYPHSVHPFYTPFCIWLFFQGIVGSMVSVLSTQALLISMGLSSENAITSAVALQWVIKDALGQFGGIAAAGLLAGRFDIEAKKLRFISIGSMYLASLLEIVALTMPYYFLLFASVANLVKNISWIITSATRASLLTQFTKDGHLGDLTAKSASQGTAAGLIGTSIGVILSNYFGLGTYQSFLTAFFPLSIVGILCLYKSAQYIISSTLTRQRMDILLDDFWHHMQSSLISYLSSTEKNAIFDFSDGSAILKPDQVSSKERFVPFSFGLIYPSSLPNVSFNPPLYKASFGHLFASAVKDPSDHFFIRMEKIEKKNQLVHFYIWMTEEAESRDYIFAYFKLYFLNRFIQVIHSGKNDIQMSLFNSNLVNQNQILYQKNLNDKLKTLFFFMGKRNRRLRMEY